MELSEKEKDLILSLRAEEAKKETEKNKQFVRKVGYLKENFYRNDREEYTRYKNYYSETEKKIDVEDYESDFRLIAEAGAKVYLEFIANPHAFRAEKQALWVVSTWEVFHESWGEKHLRDITVVEEEGK